MEYKKIYKGPWDTSEHIDADVKLVNKRTDEKGRVVRDVEINGVVQNMQIVTYTSGGRCFAFRIGRIGQVDWRGNPDHYYYSASETLIEAKEECLAAWNKHNGRKVHYTSNPLED